MCVFTNTINVYDISAPTPVSADICQILTNRYRSNKIKLGSYQQPIFIFYLILVFPQRFRNVSEIYIILVTGYNSNINIGYQY